MDARTEIAGDLIDAGFEVIEAQNGLDGWQQFRRNRPQLVVSDVKMPGADGLELLRRIRRRSNIPVIFCTPSGEIATAVSAIKAGAQEFLKYPDDRDRVVRCARELTGAADTRIDTEAIVDRIVGRSAAARRVRDRVRALAPLNVPVLVCGEPGVGHDHVVGVLHALGAPDGQELVFVTPADAGLRCHPPAGSFYLDEIGSFSPADQAHWYERLRESEGRDAAGRFRILASTSENLPSLVRSGAFHPALARCMLRFRILLAPVRHRPEDIGPITTRIAERIAVDMGRTRVRLDRAAIALLRARTWPGNIRDLASIVEKLVAFSPDGEITAARVREVLGESPDSVASMRIQKEQKQREELVSLLEACGGNLAEVARRLQISRGAVIYRAQKHGLIAKPS
jgi:two-component system NtrC family response regulator